MGDEKATAAWWRAEADGWRRENDRHRALYVEAVKERDRLRAVALAVIRAYLLAGGTPDGLPWVLNAQQEDAEVIAATRALLDGSPDMGEPEPIRRLRQMGDEAADRATPSDFDAERAVQRVLDEVGEEGVRRYLERREDS